MFLQCPPIVLIGHQVRRTGTVGTCLRNVRKHYRQELPAVDLTSVVVVLLLGEKLSHLAAPVASSFGRQGTEKGVVKDQVKGAGDGVMDGR